MGRVLRALRAPYHACCSQCRPHAHMHARALPTTHPLQPDAHKKKLESASARTERLAAEAELAKALEEDEDEGDVDF